MTNFARKSSMVRLFYIVFWLFILLMTNACDTRKSNNTEEIAGSEAADSSQQMSMVDRQKTLVTAVRQQSKLYTTEYEIHKIILYSDNTRFGGKLLDIPVPGTRKVAIPIDVTLKAYVDFSEFSERNVLIADSMCIITLPDPKVDVTASKVDHSKTRQYISMTRTKFSEEEISELTAQGEDSIVKHINNFGIIEQSRKDCARILVPIMMKMGFDAHNIMIRYRKDYSEEDIRHLTHFDHIERQPLK